MSELLNRILQLIQAIPWTQLRDFLQILFAKQKFALLSCFLLLIFSITLLMYYYNYSYEYEKIVSSTLEADLEQTPQRYKGLEAFIMSNVKEKVDEDLRTKKLNTEFINQLKRLESDIDSFNFNNIEKPSLHLVPDTNNLINDGNETTRGFLYFPIDLIRPEMDANDTKILNADKTKDKDNEYTKKQNELIAKKLEINPSLKIDVALTKHLSGTLQGFTSLPVIRGEKTESVSNTYLMSQPPQVYIITKNGLNRIFNTSAVFAEKYYGRQFPPNISFPSRPYFQAAIKEFSSIYVKGKSGLVPTKTSP